MNLAEQWWCNLTAKKTTTLISQAQASAATTTNAAQVIVDALSQRRLRSLTSPNPFCLVTFRVTERRQDRPTIPLDPNAASVHPMVTGHCSTSTDQGPIQL